MKYYVQFFEKAYQYDMKTHIISDKIGYKQESIGSDGVFILDARNNLSTMIQDAKERMSKMTNVHKYIAFTINKGDFKYSTIVYDSNPELLINE